MAKKMELSKPDVESSEDELKRYRELFDELTRFTSLIDSQEDEIAEAVAAVAEAKEAYDAAKDALRELESIRYGAKHNLYRFLSPKDGKFQSLPLFDQMDAAVDSVHGANSAVWRNDPISSAGICLPSVVALTDANLALIGCLQDRVMKSPDDWWRDVSGLNSGSAKRVVERLNDFIFKKTQE